jgi:outer membrane protein TolC
MNKNYSVFIFLFCFICSIEVQAQTILSLEDIIVRSKGESPSSRQAETRKENRYWQYRFFRTNYNPQLRLMAMPTYQKSVNGITQPDGTVEYVRINNTDNFVSLGLQQPISWTGGTISANTSLNYFNNYIAPNVAPGDPIPSAERWRGNVMNVRLDQPLLSFNPLRWDKKTEPLRFEESKREYVEQMEFISREAVTRFFNVLQSQVGLQIARFNLANNDTIYKIEQGRYNIGTTSLDKLLQVELQLLRSKQAVAQSNLDLETARLQLRSYIGLNENTYELKLPEEIPAFEVTIDEALLNAKQNRAAFLAFERRRIEADREVAQARGQRFEAGFSATYGLNDNGFRMPDAYDDPTEMQQVNLSINIPILDWGRNKSRMRTAMANKKLNDYVIAQDEVNFEQEIMTQVRQFEMLRLQIEITKKSDEVAAERYNVAQNRYLIGKIDITNLNIALEEKDQAKQSYIQALKSFWTAYYDLRRLTLYDFAGKKLLYTPDK